MVTSRLLLRRFRAEDLDEVRELNAYGLSAAGIALTDDYYADEDLSDAQHVYSEGAGGVLLVGEVEGRVIAMGGIRRMNEATCELLRMRVYPEQQGKGYGSTILRALEVEAMRLGYERIVLITGEQQHPAIDLYARRGYRVVKREVLIGIASVHMAKDLAPTSSAMVVCGALAGDLALSEALAGVPTEFLAVLAEAIRAEQARRKHSGHDRF